tara:strand:+ start:1029 stop:1130 length:102 start_codon:yes stop_codon:yes gene_type:complete
MSGKVSIIHDDELVKRLLKEIEEAREESNVDEK